MKKFNVVLVGLLLSSSIAFPMQEASNGLKNKLADLVNLCKEHPVITTGGVLSVMALFIFAKKFYKKSSKRVSFSAGRFNYDANGVPTGFRPGQK